MVVFPCIQRFFKRVGFGWMLLNWLNSQQNAGFLLRRFWLPCFTRSSGFFASSVVWNGIYDLYTNYFLFFGFSVLSGGKKLNFTHYFNERAINFLLEAERFIFLHKRKKQFFLKLFLNLHRKKTFYSIYATKTTISLSHHSKRLTTCSRFFSHWRKFTHANALVEFFTSSNQHWRNLLFFCLIVLFIFFTICCFFSRWKNHVVKSLVAKSPIKTRSARSRRSGSALRF